MVNILEFIGGIFEPAARLIDDVTTSDEERLRLRKEMDEVRAKVQTKMIELEHQQLEYEKRLVDAQQAVVVAEAQGKSWLQRMWRPILMLVIIVIIANNYVLLPYIQLFFENAPALELPPELFTLLSVGVGGYVVGRSGEKIANSLRDRVVGKETKGA